MEFPGDAFDALALHVGLPYLIIPVYLETLPGGKKRYVDADGLEPHAWHCSTRDDVMHI